MKITRRGFLKALIALPGIAYAMPALAKVAPKTFHVHPLPEIMDGDLWWFTAKRACVIEVPGHLLFVLEPDEACCFLSDGGKWKRVVMKPNGDVLIDNRRVISSGQSET